MTHDAWESRRQLLQDELRVAVLNLFAHMKVDASGGPAAFVLPIDDGDQLVVAAGDRESLAALISASSASLKSSRT